jgi:hypothetical protein
MIEKMQPYETPIMKKLGTVKDLTQATDRMVCTISGGCDFAIAEPASE